MYKYMCAKEKAAKVIEVKVLDSLQILPFSDKDTQGHTRCKWIFKIPYPIKYPSIINGIFAGIT